MSTENHSTLVVVTRNGMGHADEELQLKLMGTWLKIVQENGALPGALALYSEGVRLATDDSPVLEDLKALEARGVHIILCKTCIDSLGLADRIGVGVVGGMGDIVAAQWEAKKIVSL